MASALLVRHAESASQSPESPLTEAGERQAEALAEWLLARYQVDRIVSSPYRRALETIRPFARAAGLHIEEDARIAERMPAAGFASEEEWLKSMRRVFSELDYRPGDSETSLEVRARGLESLTEILDAGNDLTVMVSHGQFSTNLLGAIDSTFGYDNWRSMTNPDVFLIESTLDGMHLERVWQ